jgi:hypothetical protein
MGFGSDLSSVDRQDGFRFSTSIGFPARCPNHWWLDNAERILRDSAATEIRSHQLDIAPRYGVIATRASGVLYSGDRVVRTQFHNYVVNTAAGGALIEQAIAIGADEFSALDPEANELTENLYQSLLTSIDRTPNIERA